MTYEQAAKPKSDLIATCFPPSIRGGSIYSIMRALWRNSSAWSVAPRAVGATASIMPSVPMMTSQMPRPGACIASGSGFDASCSWLGTDAEIRVLWKRHPAFYVGGWR